MNKTTKVVVGAVTVWLFVYLVVYLVFILTGNDTSLAEEGGHKEAFAGFKGKFMFNKLKRAGHIDADIVSHTELYQHLTAFTATDQEITKPDLWSNPFLSSTCENSVRSSLREGVLPRSIAVIIPVRNEKRDVLVHSVKSIFYNSGAELKTVVLVDDRSDEVVKEWEEWDTDAELASILASKCDGGNKKQCLRIVRPKRRLGVAGAKAYGADIFAMAHDENNFGGVHDALVKTLVFVDAHVVVSPDWLLPLAHTLDKHDNPGGVGGVVYPQIDVIDRGSGGLAKAGNVVGAFDWSLAFRWENVDDPQSHRRLGSGGKAGVDSVLPSPARPGIMALSTKTYRDLGGFDTNLKPWGQENIELSLRVWLCGGYVLRQPCSRVAQRYDNLFTDTLVSASNGVSAGSVDRNVMAVAEHWFTAKYREIVYKARFAGRVPYTVDVSHDSRAPQRFSGAKPVYTEKCNNIEWYLKEVYPGLNLDVDGVEAAFSQHLESDYLEKSLKPAVMAHYSADNHAQEGDVDKVVARAETSVEKALQRAHDRLVPAEMYNPVKHKAALGRAPPKPVEVFKSEANGNPHEEHANKIRETLVCEDEPPIPNVIGCKERVATEGCTKNRYYMIFGCPRTCGMCGTDGLMCVDFYEKKCPQWAKEGRCTGEESEQLKHDCRLSCGHCHLVSLAVGANNHPGGDVHTDLEKHEVRGRGVAPPPPPPKKEGEAVTLPLPSKKQVPHSPAGVKETLDDLVARQEKHVSVTVAQEEWRSTQATEGQQYRSKEQACPLPTTGPHVKLLNRITVSSSATANSGDTNKAVRIFCGIYTYDRNHKTNVRATRDTWAKRCDGFLAFSTLSDPSIPAINILHEGPEEYDNMWQKSRSIWRYVYTHLVDEFDFFLLGGDDMFYMVENLRKYLASEEITERREDAQTSGLFLGRRFFPPKQEVFNSGGAGYVLDVKALRVLGKALVENSPKCWPHQKGFWEDVNVANCLRQMTAERKEWGPFGQIMPYDTRDAKHRERFHPFTPGQHLEYKLPRPGVKDWYQDYNPELKLGFECCSTESVSFHYVPHDLMRKMYAQVYYCSSHEMI